jgi:hypothetical protein
MSVEAVNKDVKTLLAKLLATEDITVVHKNMPTAYFDTKNRELGLPILKNMSGDIYDLMTLHEVGHALWTDPEDWHKIVSADNDDDLPKSFINVTEDVRIERKIKDKYPGGRRAFRTGYEKLYRDDFFGTAKRDIQESNLADRINLHSKIGDITGLEFTEEEMEIYDLCNKAVTFDDAVEAARALYSYCKNSENSDDSEFDMDHNFGFGDDSEDNDEEFSMAGESPVDMESEDETESESGQSGEESEESEESESTESGNSSADQFEDAPVSQEDQKMDQTSVESDDESAEENSETPKEMSRTGGFGMGDVTNPMQADTVIEWEDRKRDLNVQDGRDYWYGNIPQSTLQNIIDYKMIIDKCAEYYSDIDEGGQKFQAAVYQYLNKFEKESQKTINYMLKEFEMKKSADSYVRASIAKTGQLDMTKIHSYKYNEDLFRKVTVMPDGKNHGLVILVDWSGSMNRVIHDAFKQLMQIVWFCKRAGIQFEVYAFADHGMGDWFPEGTNVRKEFSYSNYEANPFWNYKVGDITVSDHVLLNMFSSRMSKMELKRSAHYICGATLQMMGCGYDHYTGKHLLSEWYDAKAHEFYYARPHYPNGLHLGGTPLNGAIATLSTLVPEYRKKNNIQNLNVVIISDGASNGDGGKIEEIEEIVFDRHTYQKHKTGRMVFGTDRPDWNTVKHYVDPITKKQFKFTGRDSASETEAHISVLRARTGCNVVGFYLAQSSKNGAIRKNDMYWLFPNQNLDEVRKELKKNRVAVADSFGYDEYYVIPTGNMALETEELKVSSEMTKGRMAKAFMNHMRGKTLNRVLLNKFVQQIA